MALSITSPEYILKIWDSRLSWIDYGVMELFLSLLKADLESFNLTFKFNKKKVI